MHDMWLGAISLLCIVVVAYSFWLAGRVLLGSVLQLLTGQSYPRLTAPGTGLDWRPGYQPAHSLYKWFCAVSAINIASNALAGGSWLLLEQTGWHVGYVASLPFALNYLRALAGLQWVVLFVWSVLWLFWVCQAAQNAQTLAPQAGAPEPGCAVMAFMFPYVNLIAPFFVMRGIWKASLINPAQPGQDRAMAAVLLAWMAPWVAMFIWQPTAWLSLLSGSSSGSGWNWSNPAPTLAVPFQCAATCFLVALAVIETVWLAQRVQRMQTIKAENASLVALS
jgi:hypothetical protein